jgi:hypothetical protein
MNWKVLVRDVAIVWVFTALGGFVIGVTAKLFGVAPDFGALLASPQMQIALSVSNLVFGIVAFSIVGALKKTDRFKHLFIVAIGAWLISAANMLFMPLTLVQWLLGALFLAVIMAIGGGISFLFVPSPKASGDPGFN